MSSSSSTTGTQAKREREESANKSSCTSKRQKNEARSARATNRATISKLSELEMTVKELREKLTKYEQQEANEITKKAEEEANKPAYPCCRHIDSSHQTKDDGYDSYCDNCESVNPCVHATGMDYQFLTWQCLDCVRNGRLCLILYYFYTLDVFILLTFS
jgi:hypothetical protein